MTEEQPTASIQWGGDGVTYSNKPDPAGHDELRAALLLVLPEIKGDGTLIYPQARDLDRLMEVVEPIAIECDEARAGVMRWRDIADYRETETRRFRDRAVSAETQVERLRAALTDMTAQRNDWEARGAAPAALPVLPDVGPVTRELRGSLRIDGYEFSGPEQLDAHERSALYELAMVHAARAFLVDEAAVWKRARFVGSMTDPSEAADTSSDDEATIDDDLLEALGAAAEDADGCVPYEPDERPEPAHVMVGRALLASEPMQRLRAVWIADADRAARTSEGQS